MTHSPAKGRRYLPYLLLILLGTAVGRLTPVLVYKFNRPPTTLLQLPAPPSPASSIVGIESAPEAWYQASAYVQTREGAIYLWDQTTLTHLWEPPLTAGGPPWEPVAAVPSELHDIECTPDNVAVIEQTAGSIDACRAAQPTGEFCPSPLVAYAIDGDGAVWFLEQAHSCEFLFNLALAPCTLGGLLLGLIMAALLRLFR